MNVAELVSLLLQEDQTKQVCIPYDRDYAYCDAKGIDSDDKTVYITSTLNHFIEESDAPQ